jgi:hypothetical protein
MNKRIQFLGVIIWSYLLCNNSFAQNLDSQYPVVNLNQPRNSVNVNTSPNGVKYQLQQNKNHLKNYTSAAAVNQPSEVPLTSSVDYPSLDNPIIPKIVPAAKLQTLPAPPPHVVKPSPMPVKKAEVPKAKPKKNDLYYPHLSVYLTGNPLTNYGLIGGEVEYRWEKFGIGAFYYGVKINAWNDDVQLTGSTYGLIGHYRFIPQYEVIRDKKFDPGVYVSIGQMKLSSSYQGDLPSYIAGSFGIDCSYPIVLNPIKFDFYARTGATYIYHSSSGVLYLDSDMSIGVKLSF